MIDALPIEALSRYSTLDDRDLMTPVHRVGCYRAVGYLGYSVKMLTARLADLGIVLPAQVAPLGAYVPAKRVGNLIYTAGQLPMKDGVLLAKGPVPSMVSAEIAHAAARQCAINALAAVSSLGPDALERLIGVARLGAFVWSDDGFEGQPRIANGASELLLELFGDAGRHARSAVGVNALPAGASVEIDFIFITA